MPSNTFLNIIGAVAKKWDSSQWRVQEFVRGGGGENLKTFFLAFQYFKGGPVQKIAVPPWTCAWFGKPRK